MSEELKLPVVVEAVQWFKMGDHPKVQECGDGNLFLYPNLFPGQRCSFCNHLYEEHGSINAPEGIRRICPGDWVLKDEHGAFHPYGATTYRNTYGKL